MPRKPSLQTAAVSNAPTRYSTPALEKGLDLLELLARQPSGLTKSDMARDLNRSVSEIFRMLVCLERRGYIAPVTGERYSLTLKLFQLVQQHPPIKRLIADALPVMNSLSHESLQSCHMGVLDAERVVILAQVNAPTNLGFYVKLGSTVDMMESASGHVILAFLHPSQRGRAIEIWCRETGKKPPKDLDAHLGRIREDGYEKRASYLVKGVLNISSPIFNDRADAVGALTVPYIELSAPAKGCDEITALLRSATAEITAAIGGKSPAEVGDRTVPLYQEVHATPSGKLNRKSDSGSISML